jgi:hypothetical protein
MYSDEVGETPPPQLGLLTRQEGSPLLVTLRSFSTRPGGGNPFVPVRVGDAYARVMYLQFLQRHGCWIVPGLQAAHVHIYRC